MKAPKRFPKVSIIILNHNGLRHLKECLESVAGVDYPDDKLEVILVDNGSQDESVNFVRENFPSVKLVTLEKNLGFAEGNNVGEKYASGEYLMFLNNDTRVAEKWLAELVKTMNEDESIGICGSKILFYRSPDTVNYAGGKITPIGSGYEISFGCKDTTEANPKHVGYASGASMIMRRSLFQELEGFDKSYFIYCEDVDLSWRAWLRGYRVVYVPTSIVYHKFTGTSTPEIAYLWHRNAAMNIIKNFGALNLVKGICFIFMFSIVKILEALGNGMPSVARSITYADTWVLRNLSVLIHKRRRIQATRKLSDIALTAFGVFANFKESFIELQRSR